MAYVYVPEGMATWQTALLTTALFEGRTFREGTEPFEVVALSSALEPVRTGSGLRVLPDVRLVDADLRDARVLVLPGCASESIALYDCIIDLVRDLIDRPVVVAAIGTATLALAHHGILDVHAHTSCSVQHLQLRAPGYQGAEFHRDEPAVRDGLLVTASALAPLDFARATLEALGLSSDGAIEAWYSLLARGSDDDYYRLMEEVSGLGR